MRIALKALSALLYVIAGVVLYFIQDNEARTYDSKIEETVMRVILVLLRIMYACLIGESLFLGVLSETDYLW